MIDLQISKPRLVQTQSQINNRLQRSEKYPDGAVFRKRPWLSSPAAPGPFKSDMDHATRDHADETDDPRARYSGIPAMR